MTDADGWIGQSNMNGVTDWNQLASPATPTELAHLKFFQSNAYLMDDTAGQWSAMAFDPLVQGPVKTPFDYPPNYGQPTLFSYAYTFGPEIYGGLRLLDYRGADPLGIKCAVGGTTLTVRPVGANGYEGGWFWSSSHLSWDTTIARSSTPFVATAVDSGTATSSVTVILPLSRITDPTKSWPVNRWVGHWVTMGGSQGIVLTNAATTVDVLFWLPNGFGAPPAAGAYTISKRTVYPASLAKAFIDGKCVGAKAADPTMDLKSVFVSLGESDAANYETAIAAKRNMLALIWYIRQRAVANGVTSLAAERLPFVLTLNKTGTIWTYADIVNQGYREIAESDPFVGVVEVQDLSLGGAQFTGQNDQVHYSAEGQKILGTRMADKMIELWDSPVRSRRSHTYYRRHRVYRPLWGIGTVTPSAIVPTAAAAAMVTPSRLMPPGAYVARDEHDSDVPIYSEGGSLNNHRGLLAGFASPIPMRGQIGSLGTQATPPDSPFAGASVGEVLSGHVLASGQGAFRGLDDVAVAVASANQSHTIHAARGAGGKVSRWITSVPSSSIANVEWMRRGYSGSMGLAATLLLDEYIANGTQKWMRHRLSTGDLTFAQVAGAGRIKLCPTVGSADRLIGTGVAMDLGADEVAPTTWSPDYPGPYSTTIEEVNHGGVSADCDAVVWPDVEIDAQVDANWLGIEGCFRVVHGIRPGFDIGSATDFITLQQRVFVDRSAFDTPFAYDAATATYTALTTVGNLTFTLARNNYVAMTSAYVLDSSGAGPIVSGHGAVGYRKAGGLVVAMYNVLGGPQQRTRVASITASGLVAAAAAPSFATYDQLDHAYLMQVAGVVAGPLAAGGTHKWASFLLVGSFAQVTAAADQLHAMGVDASWVA